MHGFGMHCLLDRFGIPSGACCGARYCPEALALAGKNVEALGLGDRVEVCESDLLGALDPSKKGSFDLIVSNPPYVPTKVCDSLPREVSEWDPRLALDGGGGRS